MIYLIQNDQEYDYDVRATALAFFERTKIVEVTKEEFEKQGWRRMTFSSRLSIRKTVFKEHWRTKRVR